MKKIFTLMVAFTVSVGCFAQGNGKAKGKGKVKDNKNNVHVQKSKKTDDTILWEGTDGGKEKGYAKNQPKKVRAALLRDYPAARNIVWSKYKGDYTATFTNGIWRSTAVYHANGDRRDTRTILTRKQLPGTIWDKIFKRDNVEPKGYIQIERPTIKDRIFRILLPNNTAAHYDENGNIVEYDY